jgi:hypothetical protein
MHVASGANQKKLTKSLKKFLSTQNSKNARELLESNKTFHGINKTYMHENRNYQSGNILDSTKQYSNDGSPQLSQGIMKNKSQEIIEYY